MESRKSTMDAITFQRRHYQFIASLLKAEMDLESTVSGMAALQGLARSFASRLASTNPNFDRARFLAACGME
jgi:hypothetical protein